MAFTRQRRCNVVPAVRPCRFDWGPPRVVLLKRNPQNGLFWIDDKYNGLFWVAPILGNLHSLALCSGKFTYLYLYLLCYLLDYQMVFEDISVQYFGVLMITMPLASQRPSLLHYNAMGTHESWLFVSSSLNWSIVFARLIPFGCSNHLLFFFIQLFNPSFYLLESHICWFNPHMCWSNRPILLCLDPFQSRFLWFKHVRTLFFYL